MRQLELTVDPLADAVAWKRKNPYAYEMCVRWAREDVAHSVRPSIKLYFELLRRPWMASKLGMRRSDAQFLLNNNLHAAVARLINREHHLGFPTRHARGDDW